MLVFTNKESAVSVSDIPLHFIITNELPFAYDRNLPTGAKAIKPKLKNNQVFFDDG